MVNGKCVRRIPTPEEEETWEHVDKIVEYLKKKTPNIEGAKREVSDLRKVPGVVWRDVYRYLDVCARIPQKTRDQLFPEQQGFQAKGAGKSRKRSKLRKHSKLRKRSKRSKRSKRTKRSKRRRSR